jgi:hypothetical protein
VCVCVYYPVTRCDFGQRTNYSPVGAAHHTHHLTHSTMLHPPRPFAGVPAPPSAAPGPQAQALDDLLSGINEWRNIQDVVRITFKVELAPWACAALAMHGRRHAWTPCMGDACTAHCAQGAWSHGMPTRTRGAWIACPRIHQATRSPLTAWLVHTHSHTLQTARTHARVPACQRPNRRRRRLTFMASQAFLNVLRQQGESIKGIEHTHTHTHAHTHRAR